MKCPNCKTEMKEKFLRIKYEPAFEGLIPYAENRAKTVRKSVYVCPGCGKTYKRTLIIKEVVVVGN